MDGTALRFGLVFLLAFGLLMAGFEASRGSAFERFVVETAILVPAVHLIDAATPDERVTVEGRTLQSPGAALHVTRGCEGIEMFLLLIAAILAFPATLRCRLRGLLAGTVLAYAMSVARLAALYYILRFSPGAWEALHGLVMPLGPILVMTLYFMHWSARAAPLPAARSSRAA